MEKIKKVETGHFYLFQGHSNANSCFIEKLQHAKTFLLYANYFLNGYLKIYDYILTRDGWQFVVKITYKTDQDADETWRVISERMRLFLSTFVRITNNEKGRTGCLVHSSYERYYFETMKEAVRHINLMRKQKLKMYRGKKRYRGLKFHYQISHSVGKGSIFFCSRDILKRRKMFGLREEVFRNKAHSLAVLQELIINTKKLHNPEKFTSSFHTFTNPKQE